MKIIYEDDAISGGGHGYLVFSDMKFPAEKKSFYLLKKNRERMVCFRFTWGQE